MEVDGARTEKSCYPVERTPSVDSPQLLYSIFKTCTREEISRANLIARPVSSVIFASASLGREAKFEIHGADWKWAC